MSPSGRPARPIEQDAEQGGIGSRFESLRIEHRVLALLVYVVLLEVVSLAVVGSVAPFGQASTTWFFACLGLLAFSLLSAPIFVPPRDALAAGIAGLLLLASMSLGPASSPPSPIGGALAAFRWVGVTVQLVVVASAIAVVLPEHRRPDRGEGGRWRKARRLARTLAKTFGQPEAMFAPPILIGILGHFQADQAQMLWLLFLVVLLVVIRPVEAFVKLAVEWRDASGEESGTPAAAPVRARDDGFVGRVAEGSTVDALRFEADDDAEIRLGSIVFASASGRQVHYQVTRAGTTETADTKGGGSRVVIAVQLGCLVADGGFRRHPWLPDGSAPVFVAKAGRAFPGSAGRLRIGSVPATRFGIGLDPTRLAEDHAAVLGATGSGKTELALHLVAGLLATDVRVLCLDFTGELRAGLDAHGPEPVRPGGERADELAEKLGRADGSKKEKEALRAYLRSIEPALGSGLDGFLEDEEKALAIVELDDLPSPRAALLAAASCLRSALRWARDREEHRRIVIVLEEDHAAVPSIAPAAAEDGEPDALLERMSEVVHQGRWIGLGLLAVSRGSSAASRGVLARCGTHVVLRTVDPACLAFLAGVLGEEHARAVPTLPRRHAVASGSAIASEAPVIVELAADPDELDAAGEADWHLA